MGEILAISPTFVAYGDDVWSFYFMLDIACSGGGDVEAQGRGDHGVGTAGGGSGGASPWASRLRGIWSTIGKIAGFDATEHVPPPSSPTQQERRGSLGDDLSHGGASGDGESPYNGGAYFYG